MMQVGRTFLALAAAGLFGASTLAFAQGLKPELAAGIQSAPDYSPPQGPYVVANGTPLYKQPAYIPGGETSVTLKRGERPTILAEGQQGLWLLVGQNGRGIGWAPRSLLCPVKLCPSIKPEA